MKLDIKALLSFFGIDFRDRGKNVARNCVAIDCPFCVEPSKSPHFNIRFDGSNYRCWKCKMHGSHILDVLKRLIPEYSEIPNRILAEEVLSKFPLSIDELELSNAEETLPELSVRERKFQSIWKSFDEIHKDSIFWDYCKKRGISTILDDVRSCSIGKYKWRLVIALKNAEGKICSFVSRHISDNANLRYMNCKREDSIIHASQLLYGLYEAIKLQEKNRLNYLLVVEGIFDAKKLWVHGIPAVALLKKVITPEQRELLTENIAKKTVIFVLLDSDTTTEDRDAIVNVLNIHFSCVKKIGFSGVKDANAFTLKQINKLKRLVLDEC